MSIFRDDENEYSKKAASSTNHPSLYLSPLLYPPNKEKWKDISETIISAFLEQGNTQLIRQYSGHRENKNGEFRFDLICYKGKCQNKKSGVDQENDTFTNICQSVPLSNGTQVFYRKDIRKDVFVNKSLSIRDTGEKYGGNSLS